MLSQEKTIKSIAELASLDPNIEVLWLYGSQAKGTAHSQSDIDLAIAFKNFNLSELDRKLRPQELSLIWSEQLNLPDGKLSIIDINTVPVYLALNVVEYGRVICSKNSAREFKEIQRIYSQYEFEMIEHK
ncbi:type VII toxin-antitoxin system MntA family adenylyltransferase antitoxin [Colwellia sp. 12G3]|uniref:type VII toxin-antitoxin system MntA family adenylyltransferase antitoxin n=1 Tax=Colwellia sp. 12G3 TaxID=2058299 RepID=UPI000C32A348|nr:nucleotidyltransferase domain-containing protein [Colwellia sp. 12G3]PKI17940.1 nucleotidyltransferase domain-containing protein [Colwellia sp. 12G3]